MKDKSKVLKTYGYMFRKLAICLPNWGGGFVTRPPIRQINCNFYGNTLNS